MEAKNLLLKLLEARVYIQGLTLKKSGLNKFANFHYYELDDFLPSVNKICLEKEIVPCFRIENNIALLEIIDAKNTNERIIFQIPFINANIKGCNEIQSLGGSQTYLMRYLFIAAFQISEPDVSDAVVGKDKPKGSEQRDSAPQSKTNPNMKGDLGKALESINKATLDRLQIVKEMIMCRAWTKEESETIDNAIIDRLNSLNLDNFINNEETDIQF
jgi:hypothetical protein